jgi:hypothetical protein
MRKRVLIAVLALVIALAAAMPLFSQGEGQTDITLHIPYKFGIVAEGTDYSAFTQYAFLLPEVRMTYYFGGETVKFGPGVRLLTFIIESMAYPLVSLELDFDPIVLNANIGGYAFVFFGLLNDLQTGQIYLPEVSAAYKLTDTFQVGTGAILFIAPEAASATENFGYIGTVFARFSF